MGGSSAKKKAAGLRQEVGRRASGVGSTGASHVSKEPTCMQQLPIYKPSSCLCNAAQ